MWELDYKKCWAPKYWCFWTAVLEKTLESPLVCKEINPVNPKWNQSWIFIGRADAEAEAPVLWSPDEESWFIRKDPDAWKDWKQEEKGTTEDELVGCHHWLDGHEFEQDLGAGDEQGSLACCSPWDLKESDMTERLNWTDCYALCRLPSFPHPPSLFSIRRTSFHPLVLIQDFLYFLRQKVLPCLLNFYKTFQHLCYNTAVTVII